MSNSKTRNNWFSSWFNPTTSSSDLSICSEPVTTSFTLGKSSTKPLNITKTLLQDCSTIAHCVKARRPTLSKFISLQRLDSVGDKDCEQNRFSYPPSKGETDRYIMGNMLPASWLKRGMPHCNLSTATSDAADIQSVMGNRISQFRSCIVSALQHLRGGLSSSATQHSDLPHFNVYQSNNFFQKQDMQESGDSLISAKPSKQQLSNTSNCLPPSTVNCVPCFVACNVKKMGSLESDPLFNSSLPPQLLKNTQEVKSESVYSEELHSLVDCASLSNVKCKMAECSVSDSSDSDLYCNEPLSTYEGTQSIYPSKMSGVYASGDDECSDVDRKSSFCCSDTCSEVSCGSSIRSETCSVCSESSDDELSDESENNSDETDSENEFCQWDRLTSCRTPWTCSQYKKRSNSPKDCSQYANSNSKDNSVTEGLGVKNEKDSFLQIASADYGSDDDDCFSVEFYSNDAADHANTVSRPSCLNSSISFILGYSDEDGYDSDEEDNISWCSEPEENTFSSIPNSHSIVDSDVSRDAESKKNFTIVKETSSSNSSCRLWDYFANKQNPLTNISLPTFNTCTDSKETKKAKQSLDHHLSSFDPVLSPSTEVAVNLPNLESNNTSYKAPSKVRFSDKVEVHHMITWSYAYREARKGAWNLIALDRDRFKCRVAAIENKIDWCFHPAHRQRMRTYLAKTFR